LAIVSQVGFTMAGSIILCLAIGYFLDKWLGTKGLFITIFIILGIIGGGVTVYRQIEEVLDLNKKNNKSSLGENKNGR
jgi:ATP synthase protein I